MLSYNIFSTKRRLTQLTLSTEDDHIDVETRIYSNKKVILLRIWVFYFKMLFYKTKFLENRILIPRYYNFYRNGQ